MARASVIRRVLDKDTREFVQKVAYETVQKFYGR